MMEKSPELKADFLEWLRTGRFRGLGPGSSFEECAKLPGWAKLGPMSDCLIYRSEGIEFYFLHESPERLYQIFADDPEAIEQLIGLKGPSLSSMQAVFQKEGIQFTERVPNNQRLKTCLGVAGGLSLYFLPEDQAERLDYLVQL